MSATAAPRADSPPGPGGASGGGPVPGPAATSRVRVWLRDLGMGARFAVTGGRESWVRTLLTGVGVGLGVMLLLLTSAIPSALAHRSDRENARGDFSFSMPSKAKSDHTALVAELDTDYHDKDVRGRLVQPEGPNAPVPPGIDALPKPGEMLVSPALRDLLASGDGDLLRERLPYRVTGTIAEEGLVGPNEFAYYAGTADLRADATMDGGRSVDRIETFASETESDGFDAILVLLVIILFVVLLMPVGVFIAAAVRFGGERRDRRLAALRLVGADGRMTRRIAAGEALAGAGVGLVLGAAFFAVLRQLASRVTLFDVSFFPSDLNPTPALAVLILCAVPAAAVVVTLLALRGVVIEPLGVVRATQPARRRLWWRLLLPLCGLALLYPMIGQGKDGGDFNRWMVIGGTVLLLIGVTALLPWVVEAVVTRLGGGSVSWQLAVRRLQLSSGTAARMVNGIAVAVAGAIALQMLFSGVQGNYTRATDEDLGRARMTVYLSEDASLAGTDRALGSVKGVRNTTPLSDASLGERPKDPDEFVTLTVGDCASLREVARLPDCRDGDTFMLTGGVGDRDTAKTARPGRTVYVDPTYGSIGGKQVPWKLPEKMRQAPSRPDPSGWERDGVLATPGALPKAAADAAVDYDFVQIDESVPDVAELVRNTVAKHDLLGQVDMFDVTSESGRFASVRTGLYVGATCVLLLIGASLLVSQLEQLRERRKLLSSLVAFGTRRRTLSLSVLWQAAIPVALGLVLATLVGLTLGAVLLKMTREPIAVDWASVVSMAGIGAGIVLLVTALSLPPLLRMMRPDGLRTE